MARNSFRRKEVALYGLIFFGSVNNLITISTEPLIENKNTLVMIVSYIIGFLLVAYIFVFNFLVYRSFPGKPYLMQYLGMGKNMFRVDT
eukprot:snap_masked-scaffold_56-processed-gene-0.16-mRNA-1 protein AED:1.00 eAED:1.00 QI:0/0/0/0/1/1/2/0/88